jgi:L-malate glycosyltransferase
MISEMANQPISMRKGKPLKIIHLASGDLWAGAEVQLYYLASALNRQAGIDLQVILLNHGTLESKLRESGVSVTVIDESRNGLLGTLIALFQVVSRIRPDIVHTHRQKENVLGSVVSLMVGAISVRTVHGEPEFAFSIWQFRKRIYALTDRLSGCYLQKSIIAVSQDLGQKLRHIYSANRVVVITNAIDTNEVSQRAQERIDLASPQGVLWVGIVGRLVPVKRMDLFVDIAENLQSRFPGRFRFLILGDGPLMADIKTMIHQKGLVDYFELPGFRENALPYIKLMDFLLITSDSEGLPMTLLEAMCLAIPVVARAIGGIPAVLRNGEFGELVQSAKPHEFVDVIGRCLEMREFLHERALRGSEHVLLMYSAERVVTEYVLLYENLARTT